MFPTARVAPDARYDLELQESLNTLQAAIPTATPVEASSTDGDEAGAPVCRICLWDDDPHTLIAPCACSGTSQFVHRECLNLWRASVDRPSAFTHCTECNQAYKLVRVRPAHAHWGAWRFRALVARDFFLAFALLQLTIVSLGYVALLVDNAAKTCLDICQPPASEPQPQECVECTPFRHLLFPTYAQSADYDRSTYYLCGMALTLALIGVFGCLNSLCCTMVALPEKPARRVHPSEETLESEESGDMSRPSEVHPGGGAAECGRRRRRRRRGAWVVCCCDAPRPRRRRSGKDECDECCDECCDSCCDSCCLVRRGRSCDGTAPRAGAGCGEGGSSCGGSNNDGCSGGNSDSKNGAGLVFIVAIVLILAFAVVGVFYGLVMISVLMQRIVLRHVHHLQLHELAEDVQVLDLRTEDGGLDPSLGSMRVPVAQSEIGAILAAA